MLTKLEQNKLRYIIACISEFANRKSLTKAQAFIYLNEHKALSFLDEFYDVEHTLSFEDAIEDLTTVSKQNGGKIS